MRVPLTLFSLLAMLFVSVCANAQSKPPEPLTQTTPTAPVEPTERQVRKTVVFITMHCLRGIQPVTAQGTGFFMSSVDSRLPGREFGYLITNRHMAMCWGNDRTPMSVQSVSIRLNRKDGSSVEVPIAGNLAWIIPPDDSVDLALSLGMPNLNEFDFRSIGESTVVTEEVFKQQSISEGLKVIFSGFFYQVPGLKHMEPIIREGVIAMIPDGDLVTTTGKTGKVYLAEVHAFHGNSGSPVLVDVRSRGGFGYDYRFLGVVSGGYSEGDENTLVIETPRASKPGNSGIAIIVPAIEVEKLINDPRVVAMRDAIVKAEQTKQSKKE
jgi:hypothetical protein